MFAAMRSDARSSKAPTPPLWISGTRAQPSAARIRAALLASARASRFRFSERCGYAVVRREVAHRRAESLVRLKQTLHDFEPSFRRSGAPRSHTDRRGVSKRRMRWKCLRFQGLKRSFSALGRARGAHAD